jgi:hypothetical protein
MSVARAEAGRARAVALAFFVGAWTSSIHAAEAKEADEPRRWLPPALELSVVSRDWQGARAVIGPLIATDFLRPTRSSQMLMGRVRLSGQRITTFVQLGLGSWRLDSELLSPRVVEVDRAGQVGAGIEWTISTLTARSPGAAVALESESTVLFRDRHAGPSTCHHGAALAGGVLVARVSF